MSSGRRLVARGLGILAASALLVAIAGLTRLPYAPSDAARGLLRLSWRARGDASAECRRATEEELASVPAHMRQEVICGRERVAPYWLLVELDGRRVLEGLVAGSGVAGDRPMYVLHDVDLEPGLHHVVVRFEKRNETGGDADPVAHSGLDESSLRSERQDTADARRRPRQTIPPLLLLDTTITIGAGDVRLVTYSPESGRLVLLGGAPAGR